MRKFFDWQKTINDYTGGELAIDDLRQKITEFEHKKTEADAAVNRLTAKIDRANAEI